MNPLIGSLTRTVEPSIEPLDLIEVKRHLRLEPDFGDDDAYLNTLITEGREYAENYTRRSLITQTWQQNLWRFPGTLGCIELDQSPVQSVTSVKYIEQTAGVLTTIDSSKYLVDTASQPGWISPAYDEYWPSDVRHQHNGVQIVFVAGFGDAASDVPERIKRAILLYCGFYYCNREMGKVPEAVNRLLDHYDLTGYH